MRDEGCHVEPVARTVDEEAKLRSSRTILAVRGMNCVNCAHRVRNSLLSVAGVVAAEVYLEPGLVEVYHDPAQTDAAALQNAVSRAGDNGHHVYRAHFVE